MRGIVYIAAIAVVCSVVGCSGGSGYKLPSGVVHVPAGGSKPDMDEIAVTSYDSVDLPPSTQLTYRLKTKGVGQSLHREFNDSNYMQLAVAGDNGIEPVQSLRSAYFTRKPLVKVVTCSDFVVDSLTHSMPYLVPKAEQLLHVIGRNFRDSVERRGGSGVRMKVTSLLRTDRTIKRLRRANRNSTDSSAHSFATTFDISYSKFDYRDSARVAHQGDLKNILGEVLKDLRDAGKCYVKYEYRQPCYHITVR